MFLTRHKYIASYKTSYKRMAKRYALQYAYAGYCLRYTSAIKSLMWARGGK